MIPCIYHESMSVPWVHTHTMRQFLYHESMSIPRVHVCTSPCQFHASMSIPWVLANNMSQCLYHESRNSVYRNMKTQNTKRRKKASSRNTIFRNTEMLTLALGTLDKLWYPWITLCNLGEPCTIMDNLRKDCKNNMNQVRHAIRPSSLIFQLLVVGFFHQKTCF